MLKKPDLYLGRVCKRGHDHTGNGQSIRYRTYRACIDCQRVRDKEPHRAARAQREAIRFPCFIYFLTARGGVKIGASRTPLERAKAYRGPRRFLFAFWSDNYGEVALHAFARTHFELLNDKSRVGKNEWYRETSGIMDWVESVPWVDRWTEEKGKLVSAFSKFGAP